MPHECSNRYVVAGVQAIRAFLACALAVVPFIASAADPPVTRIGARPGAPVSVMQPGEHALGLGGRRDGILYVPGGSAGSAKPLIVLLHGAGQRSEFFRFLFPLAEELGIAVLALDSRAWTWEGIAGVSAPDAEFIDAALRYAFEHVPIDPRRLAVGGFSDGATYALSLGLANGDLFTHVIAFSAGSFAKPGQLAGRPGIFLSHGTRDAVLDIDGTSRRVVPILKAAGYDVTSHEFDGGHELPASVARQSLEWLAR